MSSFVRHTLEHLENGAFDDSFLRMYGPKLDSSKRRVRALLDEFSEAFGEPSEPLVLCSSPGRTELGGNHTDHNHGRVLAAAVHLDCLAAAAPSDNYLVTIRSHGFDEPIVVNLSDTDPRPEEAETPQAMVRGVAHFLRKAGHGASGFNATVHTSIPFGAGLSSSAAFGVLLARIFDRFGSGAASTLELALVARQAENVHFAKPCGFMDQMTSAYMGVVEIDFHDPDTPTVELVESDLSELGYALCVVDTGGSHADLTSDYAAIRQEMTAAAQTLGQDAARGLTMAQVLENSALLRQQVGERGVLRLMHFIEEDRRAVTMGETLRRGDVAGYLRLVNQSGSSSWKLLQNCWSPQLPLQQQIPLALALSERIMDGHGACRVHGGGFAGTIQAYVPEQQFAAYGLAMEAVFGAGAVIPLRVRTPDSGILNPAGQGGGA